MSEKKNSDIIKQEDHAKVEKYSTFEEFNENTLRVEEFNENTLRVRRNLLIFSVIALFYKLSGATLTGKSSFLGLEFEHTDPEMIDLFLLCIVGYHLIHFMWLAYEHIEHYKISYLTMFGVENKELSLFTSTKKRYEQTKKIYEQTKKRYEQSKIKNSEVSKDIEKIGLELEEMEDLIKESTAKFENIKKESEARFIKLNWWRHFLIEVSFPLLIGIFASFVLETL